MTDARSRYFEFDESAAQEGGGFVNFDADTERVPFSKGLSFRPVLGTNVLVMRVDFAPHTEAPRHIHDEEQITMVIEGEMEFEVGSEVRLMRPGDVAVIPPNVPHAARTQESSCREIDVFSPPRRALLDMMNEGQ